MEEDRIRSLLEILDPKARDTLRRVLIHDQANRDAISSALLRHRDERGDDWADIIDMLTMHPEARRKAAAEPDWNGWDGSWRHVGVLE